MRHVMMVFASIFLAALVAVGGMSLAPPAAEAASKGYVKKCGGGKILLNAKEKETFLRHNKIRRDRNLRAFCVNPALQRAARAHSRDMIRRDYFSHDTKGRYTFDRRLIRFGYSPKGYKSYTTGENIAYGSGSYGAPKNRMNSWMKSPGHRNNILESKFREIGVGTYTGTFKGKKGVTMYTVDFGARRK
ncbi:MAG: CAP domain-containing protein [Rubrobacteraceae bacterium]